MNDFNKLTRKEKIKIMETPKKLGDLLYNCVINKDFNTIQKMKKYRDLVLYTRNRNYYKSIDYCIENEDIDGLKAILDFFVIKKEKFFDNNLIKTNLNFNTHNDIYISLDISTELFAKNSNNEKIKNIVFEYCDINNIFQLIVNNEELELIEKLFNKINFNDENHKNLQFICNSKYDYSSIINKLNMEDGVASFLYIKNKFILLNNNETPNYKNTEAIFNKIKDKHTLIENIGEIINIETEGKLIQIYKQIEEEICDLILKRNLTVDLSNLIKNKINKNKRKM